MRISQLLEDGLLEIGAIHTYIELYARLVVDLIPNVVLSAGFMADRAGNIYTGASTEDTPALIEPAAFSDGIVIVQVNQLVDDVSELPRVDIPASWVDFVVVADKPFYIEPLFTTATRAISSRACADGDDGDSRDLRKTQCAVPQPRDRFQHCRHRTDPADLR